MGRPYSQDLRERVVEAAAATSRRQAAARFEVGIATAVRWAATLAATGSVAARPQGRPSTSKLDPHEIFLRDLIDEQDGYNPGGDARATAVRVRSQGRPGHTVALPRRARSHI